MFKELETRVSEILRWLRNTATLFLPRKEILEEVLETLYKEKTKLYIHRDIKKIEALRNVIWHLPTEQKKFPKATKGLTKILHENKINYILDSVPGGAGKKEPETYWHVKKWEVKW